MHPYHQCDGKESIAEKVLGPHKDIRLYAILGRGEWGHLFFLIYFWLYCIFLAACGLSLVAPSRGYSSLGCLDFSLHWLLLLQSTSSRHAGFSNCNAWAWLFCGMWDLPGPGIEPMSSALAGELITTGPIGKPWVRSSEKQNFPISTIDTEKKLLRLKRLRYFSASED